MTTLLMSAAFHVAPYTHIQPITATASTVGFT
jgi:hypothetical protein